MTELVTVYDSAGGDWPLSGHGKGGYLLTYVDGWGGTWGGVNYSSNFQWAKAKFPLAWCVQITKGPVTFHTGVAVIDCEEGAASPQLACGWANREIIGKRYPTIYCNESTLEEVLKEMATHYTDRVRGRDYGIWLAHPGSPAVVPNGCQAIQYEWEGTYDVSVALPTAPFLKAGDPL